MAKKITIGRPSKPARVADSPPRTPSRKIPVLGHRVERATVADEVLADGEFAFATYALSSRDSMLLAPISLACWGPGQRILQSLGAGTTAYSLVGGVVFGNHKVDHEK